MTPGACPCCQLWVAQDGDEKPAQAVAVERAALVESQPHSCADCQRRARFIRRVVGAHERVVRVFGRFVKPEALLCDSGLIRVAGLRAADQVRLSRWELEALLLRRWAEGGRSRWTWCRTCVSFVDVEVDCVALFLVVSLPSATVAPARALCWIASLCAPSTLD